MVNKKGQEVYTIVGTVLRKFPPTQGPAKGGKTWTKNQFLIKTVEGNDLYISKFGSFSHELIGKDVSFQATKYNDTNYTVEGEISETVIEASNTATTVPAASSALTTVPAIKRRGRPAKVEDVASIPVSEAAPVVSEGHTYNVSTRENCRSEAESSVITNLNSAIKVLSNLGLKGSVTDLVAVADLIGRTQTAIFMDAKKDQRMTSFNR